MVFVLGLGQADHLLESGTLAGVFAADALVYENELLRQEVAVGVGVLADLGQLGVGGVFGLILGGDPDIGRSQFVFHRCDTSAFKPLVLPFLGRDIRKPFFCLRYIRLLSHRRTFYKVSILLPVRHLWWKDSRCRFHSSGHSDNAFLFQ